MPFRTQRLDVFFLITNRLPASLASWTVQSPIALFTVRMVAMHKERLAHLRMSRLIAVLGIDKWISAARTEKVHLMIRTHIAQGIHRDETLIHNGRLAVVASPRK